MNNQFFEEEYKALLILTENISKVPRFYQANTSNTVADLLYQGARRILIKSPTGTGKTLISKLIALSERVRDSINLQNEKTIRILFIANKNRLIRQAQKEYKENKSIELITHSAFSAIPQSVIDKGWDITFIDEAHHEAMSSIQLLLDNLIDKPIMGFTADEKRGDGLLVKFEHIVTSIDEKEAALRGFTEKVGINTILDTGYVSKEEATCKLLNKYHHNMGNSIVFLRTEREAIAVHKYIKNKLKIKSAVLNSQSNEKDMDQALEQLAQGQIQFLVNCQKVGEGVDASNITDVILARDFNSSAEKKQYIGRAIRPDSPCAVWEFINPLKKNTVTAKSVVGLTKYERLLHFKDDAWVEKMISGEDLTWGKMSQLRVQPAEIIKPIAQNDNKPEKLSLASGGKLTLKGTGTDTNINPLESVHKLASLRAMRLEKIVKRSRNGTQREINIHYKTPRLVA